VFGKLLDSSLPLAVRISKVRTRDDNPVEPIQMKSVTVTMPGGAAAAPPPPSTSSNPVAVMETTMGTMEAEIYLDRVPRTASNFIDLANSGFYNGLHFHRVIPGFMNQFGCPKSRNPRSSSAGTGGPPDGTFKNLVTGGTETRSNGGNIKDENIDRTSNKPGTLSMANTGSPNSGGSQFFLNVADNKNLDWFTGGSSKHPVFGKLLDSSLPLAVRISKVRTRDDNPVEPIQMKSIQIRNPKQARDEAGDAAPAAKAAKV